VHPENYTVAREIRETMMAVANAAGNLSSTAAAAIKEKHGVGETTINDIVEELKKPNRDPRDGYPKPVMQKGVVAFEDLNEGMMITGKIKNVVDFGAFVDLGIKETALVHISELSDRFVKDPMDLVKVGDVLEFRIIGLDRDRRRISLSRKTERPAGEQPGAGGASAKDDGAAGKKTAPVKQAGAAPASAPRPAYKPDTQRGSQRESRGNSQRESRSDSRDDGTMYNPFAEAFKKMKEKKPT
jgi:uncharacterized protein